MNLTQLIAEQREKLHLLNYTEYGDVSGTNVSYTNWHTNSSIQLLEAIVVDIEKSKTGLKGLDPIVKHLSQICNEILDEQINNLTAVITELKQL